MRFAARVDTNHAEVVAAFRKCGVSVIDLSRVGGGCPDLALGCAGKTALAEVKRDKKAKYTPAQLDFLTWWNGAPVFRIESLEHVAQAVAFLRATA